MNVIIQKIATIAVIIASNFALLSRTATAETIFAVSYSTGELISYNSTDPGGTRATLLPGGALVSPASMAMGPDGNLYIGENGDGSTFAPRISKFEIDTLTLSTVYPFGSFNIFPGSLAFQGNDLLIGRNPFYGNTGPIVKLFNATGGVLGVSDYTTGGSLASSPGLALASDGRLFVSDQTYNSGTGIASGSVKWFDASGNYAGEFIADGANGLAGPTGIAISGNTLYTASVMSGEILQTNLSTGATTALASTGSPFEAGVLAILADGSLLTGSPSGNGNIYHYAADGTAQGSFASGLGQVGGIVTMTIVPEPGTIGLIAVGLLAGALHLRRRPTH